MLWKQASATICNCVGASRKVSLATWVAGLVKCFWAALSNIGGLFHSTTLHHVKQVVLSRHKPWSKAVSNLCYCGCFSWGCVLSGCQFLKQFLHSWLNSGSRNCLCGSFVWEVKSFPMILSRLLCVPQLSHSFFFCSCLITDIFKPCIKKRCKNA